MEVISGHNAPELYAEVFWKLRSIVTEEESRNGPVLTSPFPVMLQMYNPKERVLFDPVRRANPFFHLVEFIWMMAGSNDVRFIEQFNSRYREYAEPNTDIIWAAYGHRWRVAFGIDQIPRLVEHLRASPGSRRAVLGMWNPATDLEDHRDLPCNTTIYFRYHKSMGLDMTVLNRSNDLVWGALGANIVHMTMLHEFIAKASGMALGTYRVFTNNLHIYKNMPNFKEIWGTTEKHDMYTQKDLTTYPLLRMGESYTDFLADCIRFVDSFAGASGPFKCRWFYDVAQPMYMAYIERKKGNDYERWLELIAADDWKFAAKQWVEWKNEERNRRP